MLKLALLTALGATVQPGEPSLANLMQIMEPYLICRTPFDRQIIALQQEFRDKDLAAQRAGQELDRYSDPLALKIRQISFEADDHCKSGEIHTTIYNALPSDKGNRGLATAEIMHWGIQMRQSLLKFEESLDRPPSIQLVP